MAAPTSRPWWTHWVPVLYLAFGVLWILASDSVVGWLFEDTPHLLLVVSTLKGFAFVFLTALVLGIWWRTEQKRSAALVADAEARADVAARRRLEETVASRTQELTEARDRAEQADRAKTAFLSTISHELRTPLNSIIGFTEIVLGELSGPLNDEQRKQLGIVHESSRLLLGLINEVLDLSRIEAGRLQFNIEPFDLGDLLRRHAEAVRPQCSEKGLELQCDVAPDVGAVSSDPKRVAQIVVNLLSNAIKFTGAGSVSLFARALGDRVEIAVSDTGPGIPAAEMAHLFKPFMQGGDAQRSHREGAGLGLAIARHLARALGGDIVVQSEPGAGSRFTVTLPVESTVAQDASNASGLYRKISGPAGRLGNAGDSA